MPALVRGGQRRPVIDVAELEVSGPETTPLKTSRAASIARASSPPDATFDRGNAGSPGLAPSIQTIAQSLQLLFSGLIVVEALFAFPGIGQTLVSSVQSRDISVVQSVVLLLAALFLVINIVADLLVVLVVPKLRTALA